jgi:hypothetical protein
LPFFFGAGTFSMSGTCRVAPAADEGLVGLDQAAQGERLVLAQAMT